MADSAQRPAREAALLTRLARILPDRTLDRVFAAALRPQFPSRAARTGVPSSLDVLGSRH
jgi:hypothetical protein